MALQNATPPAYINLLKVAFRFSVTYLLVLGEINCEIVIIHKGNLQVICQLSQRIYAAGWSVDGIEHTNDGAMIRLKAIYALVPSSFRREDTTHTLHPPSQHLESLHPSFLPQSSPLLFRRFQRA